MVDDKAGLVFTNFHVVNGATKCWVTFPADRDDKRYETEGFVEVLPEKDLCLLKIVPGSKKLRSLRMAAQDSRPGGAHLCLRLFHRDVGHDGERHRHGRP